MRSDFINKRDYGRRRTGGGTPPQTVESEIIVIPEFDTFIYHDASPSANDKFGGTGIINGPNDTQVPVGLLNPWNDGEDMGPDTGSFTQTYPVRTPIRAVMAFNLSSLPAGCQVIDAILNLTVANKRNWD